MAMNGTDVLLLVDGEVVGSQRDVTFEENTAEIDVSSKTAGRAQRVIAGRYTSSISLDALYVPTDTAYQSLKAAKRAGTLVQVVRQEDGTDLEEADALITSLSEAFPDQGEATISISLTIDGDWAPAGS